MISYIKSGDPKSSIEYYKQEIAESKRSIRLLEAGFPGVHSVIVTTYGDTLIATGGADVIGALQDRLPIGPAELHRGIKRPQSYRNSSTIEAAGWKPEDRFYYEDPVPVEGLFGTKTRDGQRRIHWYSNYNGLVEVVVIVPDEVDFDALFSDKVGYMAKKRNPKEWGSVDQYEIWYYNPIRA